MIKPAVLLEESPIELSRSEVQHHLTKAHAKQLWIAVPFCAMYVSHYFHVECNYQGALISLLMNVQKLTLLLYSSILNKELQFQLLYQWLSLPSSVIAKMSLPVGEKKAGLRHLYASQITVFVQDDWTDQSICLAKVVCMQLRLLFYQCWLIKRGKVVVIQQCKNNQGKKHLL